MLGITCDYCAYQLDAALMYRERTRDHMDHLRGELEERAKADAEDLKGFMRAGI